jgi:DNA-binding MarR family transcriptional regulator
MKSFTMKPPITDHGKRLSVEEDEQGRLYSPDMREVLSRRGIPPEALPAVEAFAAISVAARQLHHRMERWCEREGLSETRLGILFMLHHFSDGVPLGVLAGRLHVSPRNVTGLIDHLERDGLVVRVPDPADRRSVLARLTEQGHARVAGMSGSTFQWQQKLLAGFSPEELTQLRHLCLKLVTNMQEVELPE